VRTPFRSDVQIYFEGVLLFCLLKYAIMIQYHQFESTLYQRFRNAVNVKF